MDEPGNMTTIPVAGTTQLGGKFSMLNASTCAGSCSCQTIQFLQRNLDACTSPIQKPHDGMRDETPVLGVLTECSQQFVIFHERRSDSTTAMPNPSAVIKTTRLSQSIGSRTASHGSYTG
jgi:hypothetical protein